MSDEYFDPSRDWKRIADALRAEVASLRAALKLVEHKVITCGVAASHPDANLAHTGAYADKWDSPQAQSVRALRAERDAARAELAETLAAIKGDRDLFVEQEREIARLRAALEELVRGTPNAGPISLAGWVNHVARAALAPHDKGTTDNGK